MAIKNNLLSAIRELSFDKFPVHLFTLGAKADSKFTLSESLLKIEPTLGGQATIDYTFVEGDNSNTILEKILGANIPIAITASFRGDEPRDSLIDYVETSMDTQIKAYAKRFFSDATLEAFIKKYFIKCLGYPETTTDEQYEEAITLISGDALEHLQLFVALTLVDFRRLYSYAQQTFDGTTFSDGSGKDLGGNLDNVADNITVQVGSVFTLNDSEDYGENFPTSDNGTSIGSENFFADFEGFWYRLFLKLRDSLESNFGDYSFRKNSGLWDTRSIDNPLSYLQYYDSYPISEQARGISRRFLSNPS